MSGLGGGGVAALRRASSRLGGPTTRLSASRAGANNGGGRGLVAVTRRVVVPTVVLAAIGLAITVFTIVLDVLAPLGKAVAVQVCGPLGLLEAGVHLLLTDLPGLKTSRLIGPSRQRRGAPLTALLLARSGDNRCGSADAGGSARRHGLASSGPGLGARVRRRLARGRGLLRRGRLDRRRRGRGRRLLR